MLRFFFKISYVLSYQLTPNCNSFFSFFQLSTLRLTPHTPGLLRSDIDRLNFINIHSMKEKKKTNIAIVFLRVYYFSRSKKEHLYTQISKYMHIRFMFICE
jgi:hypothetical protein